MELNIHHTVKDRFLDYVKIDTQSNPNSDSCPSTPGQKTLGAWLVTELLEMGITDAEIDDDGYVYATVPSNSPKNVPKICFCSHLDTSPDCSGKDVVPVIHADYSGQDLVLPKDTSQVIRVSEHPDLAHQLGNDIITADGTTLLGADNKAGVAAIMDAVNFIISHPEIRHGDIRILFTPDEEIGRGPDKVDMQKLGARFGYTVDGESAGTIEDETFSADGVTLTIHGFSTHPGFAKGKMENAVKIASGIINSLPNDRLSPETTEGKQGFIHPMGMEGNIEKVTVTFIIRAFTDEGLSELENYLESIGKEVTARYPKSSMEFVVREQYRNMKQVLDRHPEVVDYALEAIGRSGLQPVQGSIRGGTDGSRLSYMGMPCPNIFAGEHAFHSKQEWVSVQDMEKAVETIIHLCMIWEERA